MIVDGWLIYTENITFDSFKNLFREYNKISFGDNFNRSIDDIIFPDNIEFLYFGASFNQRVDNLPTKLRILSLGCSFNHELDNLPLYLEELRILGNYDKCLDLLPRSLKKLTLGNKYNHPLDNLPEGME